MKRKYLGPRETEVIARLSYEKTGVITRRQFDDIFKFDAPLANQVIFRLKRKGILKPVKRGVYFYSPLESGPAGSNLNEFLVPSIFFPKGNYYVGYSTMFSYYGFTDQIFQTMYILNTSVQSQRTIGSTQFRMVRVSEKRMYGLEKIKTGKAEVIISDKERTLIDLIYFPNPVGGLRTAFDILEQQAKAKNIDLRKLVGYASIFPSISTRKRIGFVLSKCGQTAKELRTLLKSIGKTSLSTLYDSKSRRGRINNEWRIIENAASR